MYSLARYTSIKIIGEEQLARCRSLYMAKYLLVTGLCVCVCAVSVRVCVASS